MRITDNPNATPEEELHAGLTMLHRVLAVAALGTVGLNLVLAMLGFLLSDITGRSIGFVTLNQTVLNVLGLLIGTLWAYVAVAAHRAGRAARTLPRRR